MSSPFIEVSRQVFRARGNFVLRARQIRYFKRYHPQTIFLLSG
ncbi:hypothetical protein PCH70_18600 [Pseudomonas cichorii JBC1]|nr:hypothetical protein PCH70_18600 [Pseudomonas cichorii JBC1]